MCDMGWKYISDSPFSAHLRGGDFVSFLCIALGVWLFNRCYSFNNSDRAIYAYLEVVLVLCVFVGVNFTANIINFFIMLWVISSEFWMKNTANVSVVILDTIRRWLKLDLTIKKVDEICEGIEKNRITIRALGVMSATYFLAIIQVLGVNVAGVVCFFALAVSSAILLVMYQSSKTTYFITLFFYLLILFQMIVIVQSSFPELQVGVSRFWLVLLLDLYVIGFTMPIMIILINKMIGDKGKIYIKLILYVCIGYGICKSYIEFTASYFINDLEIITLKNIIDSILQIGVCGSVFCYAGANLFNRGCKNDDNSRRRGGCVHRL